MNTYHHQPKTSETYPFVKWLPLKPPASQAGPCCFRVSFSTSSLLRYLEEGREKTLNLQLYTLKCLYENYFCHYD